MTANRYTTQELVDGIRRVSHIAGVADITFDDQELLAFADTECETAILAQILSTRENFYLYYEDRTPAADGRVPIPTRAIGGALADVQLVSGNTLIEIVRTEISDQWSTDASPMGVYSFYIERNDIVVKPTPVDGLVRLYHYRKPNRLITVANAGRIEAIDPNTRQITLSNLPTGFTGTQELDLIKDQPFFDWLAIDVVPTATAGVVITLSTIPTGLAVGDWVARAGQTPVPQIPVEFRPLLEQRVAVKICEAQGYLQKMQAAQAKLEQMEKSLSQLINPRVAEEPKRIVISSDWAGGWGHWRIPPAR